MHLLKHILGLMVVYTTLIQCTFASTPHTYTLERTLTGGESLNPMSLAMQGDGKVLIGDYFGYFIGPFQPAFTFLTRWNQNGTLDQNFSSNINGAVHAIAVLDTGKILVGGAFTEINGETRFNLARLNADGSLDLSWNSNADATVSNIEVLASGQIVVSGSFLHIGGDFTEGSGAYRNRVARLNADGSVDESFNPNVNGVVSSMLVLADGEIYITGDFSSVSGIARNKIARLNADGTLDTEFNFNGAYLSYHGLDAYQNGQLIVGGAVHDAHNTAGRTTTLLRLNQTGSVDEVVEQVDGDVYHLAILDDESLLVGGFFDGLGAISAANLGRIAPDGTVDTEFNGDRFEKVQTMEKSDNGSVILGDRGSVRQVARQTDAAEICIPVQTQSRGFSIVCI